MSSQKPPWWRAFDKAERAIGEPLEDVVASHPYVDVVVAGMKLQRAVGALVFGVATDVAERALRAAQVPTRSDVRRLSEQLTVLTSELRALRLDQQQLPPAEAKAIDRAT